MNSNNKDELIQNNVFQTCKDNFHNHKSPFVQLVNLVTCCVSCFDALVSLGYDRDSSKEMCGRVAHRLCKEKYSDQEKDKNTICNSFLGKGSNKGK